ncbi:MAG: putative drug exporter of the superfamily [Solirubrobacteraceae bacterium]|nr:putative drug exporter of the superfamily [Solirubrobacteraceae bacterium]
MAALANVVGRHAKWAVAAIWLLAIVGSFATDLPGRFTDAEQNESTSFLPGDAESTKALAVSKRLQGGELAPLVIVYRRAQGLIASDLHRIAADTRALNRLDLRATARFGKPVRSPDGKAAIVQSSIKSDGQPETILDPVDAVRKQVSDRGGELQVKVTGAAAFSADSIKIFEGINGTLLGAAFLLVLVLLALIYRSPIFLWIPLLAVGFAEIATRAFGYGLTELGVTVNGQSSAILSILVLGAGTDYALLLVARYREELRRHADHHEAMALALRTAGPAILASGMTVIAALLCLMLADVNGTSGLGPVAALGIAIAMHAMLTLLPALLLICGRRAFWPFIPRFGDVGADETHGRWRAVGERVALQPRRIWIGVTTLLAVLALGLLNFDDGLTRGNSFRDDVESVQGQELLSQSFPSGANAPTEIIIRDPKSGGGAVRRALAKVDGIAKVTPPVARGKDGVLLDAVLKPAPFSTEAFALIPQIRAAVKRASGPGTLVGGATAVEADLRVAAARDRRLIVPVAIVVVFLILVLLLRALVAPLLLMGTVVLSFAASLGVGAVIFDVVFGFPGSDPSLPLFAFIFLVALGIDYNIFLMARVREETERHGTREGMLRGLAVTGGVITSAGIVLAGTFSVLSVLPLVNLTQIGFVVAFGVLLDTFIVRSVLVPALAFEIGPKIWWPSKLAKGAD